MHGGIFVLSRTDFSSHALLHLESSSLYYIYDLNKYAYEKSPMSPFKNTLAPLNIQENFYTRNKKTFYRYNFFLTNEFKSYNLWAIKMVR